MSAQLWGVVFDVDETLVLTSALESLRRGRRWKEVYAAFPKTTLPIGTLEFIQAISKKAQLAVVTKAPKAYAVKLLVHHGIDIPVVIGFHDVKRVKPDPEALLLAAQKLGLEPSKCIYVGDDASDVQAARAAQFRPIGVCWGKRVNIGLSSVCSSWDEVYDEILRLIQGMSSLATQRPTGDLQIAYSYCLSQLSHLSERSALKLKKRFPTPESWLQLTPSERQEATKATLGSDSPSFITTNFDALIDRAFVDLKNHEREEFGYYQSTTANTPSCLNKSKTHL